MRQLHYLRVCDDKHDVVGKILNSTWWRVVGLKEALEILVVLH